MAALPNLKPGLDLYCASDEAIFVGVILFSVSLIPLLALFLALPVSDEPFSWLDWYTNLMSLRDPHYWAAFLTTRWPHAAMAFAISVTAAYLGCLDARDEAPLAEPFATPDKSQARIYYDHDARRRLGAQFRAEAGRSARKGIWLAPHLNLPFELESRYALVLGASGHGKSNLVRAYSSRNFR
ncbi:hypothetical protein HAP41_0000045285 [Bradyrhizobium barranii subsp. apii]|uniref:Uncharacterized protein n=1 Tax=Bradyrhizobium barranii subsp. apii TaxID=2819348 RepID=A0A8T5UXD0_9BRAD|nr:hypothetical protein [Bradyrhizobium barranii]UPT87269.1 hypothetical protein HAP41_0000045285 [Bradyrhizobium barranii subsp. apii]